MEKALAVVAVLIIAVLGIQGLSAQYQQTVTDSQNQTVVENETFTAAANTTVILSESNRDVVYGDSPLVYDNATTNAALSGNGTVRVQSEGNWSWNRGNGSLRIPNSSTFADGGDANVTYGYYVPTGSQRVTRDIGMVPFQLGGLLGVIAGAALLLGSIFLLARQA